MCIDNDIDIDIEFLKLAKCMANQAHSVHIVPYILNDTVLLDTPLYLYYRTFLDERVSQCTGCTLSNSAVHHYYKIGAVQCKGDLVQLSV